MTKREPGTTIDPDDPHYESHFLQSKYHAVKILIAGEGERIARPDTDTFKSIIDEVQYLHQFVRRPKEQVSDAEALWSITNSLLTGVKLLSNDEITLSDFITCLLREFSERSSGRRTAAGGENLIRWKDIGIGVSHLMRTCYGCQNMIGPMSLQLKQRKTPASHSRRKRAKCDVLKMAYDGPPEQRETGKGMEAIFGVLRKKRRTKLENLVLNRNSFARTVENIFALSFLVKDGRVEIEVDENGFHLVSARNAPSASAVASGDAVYRQFVFRFDFQDWLLMKSSVADGEELIC